MQEKKELESLVTLLQKEFLINCGLSEQFDLYPFSNEYNYESILTTLNMNYTKNTEKIRVAMLFGESRFLSILPELAKCADIVILADIEPRLHLHNKHLLTCFKQSVDSYDFIACYKKNNPIENEKLPWLTNTQLPSIATLDLLEGLLVGSIGNSIPSLGEKYHFLHNEKRFQSCKEAVNKLFFVQIHLNLMDSKQCYQLAEHLSRHNAELTLVNFTNIADHQYGKMALQQSIPLLLKDSPDCFILYSTGVMNNGAIEKLNIHITQNLDNYFNQSSIPNETSDKKDNYTNKKYTPNFFETITNNDIPSYDTIIPKIVL
ncbi:hypothetical protein ACNVED_04030 [Legionella sp. D16C41]|uniref:hypothetical protein n=1 Tax=Legionella sp. D16C41 TaxID=3402688 RepID=UPI003AF650FF